MAKNTSDFDKSIIDIEEDILLTNKIVKRFLSFLLLVMRRIVGLPSKNSKKKKKVEVSVFGEKLTSFE